MKKENNNKVRHYFELDNNENTSHHTSWQTNKGQMEIYRL